MLTAEGVSALSLTLMQVSPRLTFKPCVHSEAPECQKPGRKLQSPEGQGLLPEKGVGRTQHSCLLPANTQLSRSMPSWLTQASLRSVPPSDSIETSPGSRRRGYNQNPSWISHRSLQTLSPSPFESLQARKGAGTAATSTEDPSW